MTAIEFSLRTRIVSGADAIDDIAAIAQSVGGARAFVVTDPGLVAAGHVERVERALRAGDLEVHRFSGVNENPTETDVDACRSALGDWPADLFIGLGGGSSIDVAKGCNFVRAGGGRMADYWGVGKARGTLLPLIAVPTTAGTGTEVQSFALIEQDATHQKMACGDPRATPRVAILDPTLTVSQPPRVTACTGLDTVGHAVETAVTKKRNAVSRLFSTAAFQLADANFERVLERPEDLDARGHMLRAAAYAGLAIENSMLGAAHAMANPLTANFDLAHGEAVGMMLPHVVRYNATEADAAKIYAELARDADLCGRAASDDDGVVALLARLETLLVAAGFAGALHRDGLAQKIPALATEAACQWTAQFNPRPVTEAGFVQLFTAATT